MKKMILLLILFVSACAPAATATPVPTATVVPTATKPSTPLSLVAIGDSLPFNSQDDCRGCVSFVDRYAADIQKVTGRLVNATNLSEHNGLTIEGLLQELRSDKDRRDALANADVIVVSIAGNSTVFSRNDDPCDGAQGDLPDWSMINATCSAAAAEAQRSNFERVFSQIVALRAGKPTIFRTVNMYNAFFGRALPDGMKFPPEAVEKSRMVLDDWNAMVCKAAHENGFVCADIYHAFNGADGLAPATEFTGTGNNIHPSNKGNQLIARVLSDLGYAPIFP